MQSCRVESILNYSSTKSKRECGGWRDEGGFVFQQETGADKKTARRRPVPKILDLNETNFHTERAHSEPSNLYRFDGFSSSLECSLPQCIESQAVCFFVTECVLVPRQLHLEHSLVKKVLIPLYVQAGMDSPLVSVILALSLRAFSQQPGRRLLLFKSEKHYGQAISRLNQALASPTESKSDATLLSVLMLLVRETTSMTESSPRTWRQHVRGAIQIVKLRGRGSFKGYSGRRLFAAVREQCLSVHISTAQAIPQDEIEHVWKTSHLGEVYCSGDTLVDIAVNLPGLREKALKILYLPVTTIVVQETLDLLASLRQLDAKFAAWRFTVTRSWDYKTIYKHTFEAHEDLISSPVWPGDVHAYRDLWGALGWNSYRMLRIICQTLIINCLERLHPLQDLLVKDVFLNSVHIIQRLANDICSTIPFINMTGPDSESPKVLYADWKMPAEKTGSDDTSKRGLRPDPEAFQPLALNIGGLGIIYHLFIVSTLFHIPQEQREWARHQMYMLGKNRGMDQATVIRTIGDMRTNALGRSFCVTDLVPTPYEEVADEPLDSWINPSWGSS